MSPNAAHKRFWSRMAKRFGARWYEDRGQEPNDEWCTLLDRYTAQQLEAALELMWKREWPGNTTPNHPQFESLLATAALKSPAGEIDQSRGYWRSVVLDDIERSGALAKLWEFGVRIPRFDESERHFVMREARIVIDRACQSERDGESRAETSARVRHQINRIIAAIRQMRDSRAHLKRAT